MTINIFVLKRDLNGKIVVVPFFFCRVYNRLFCCTPTFYYVGMVSVTSASRYVTSASRYQSRSSMYIRGMIPLNSTELAEAVPIDSFCRFCNNYDVGMICFLSLSYHAACAFVNEPRHEISNNVVCATSKVSDQPAHSAV